MSFFVAFIVGLSLSVAQAKTCVISDNLMNLATQITAIKAEGIKGYQAAKDIVKTTIPMTDGGSAEFILHSMKELDQIPGGFRGPLFHNAVKTLEARLNVTAPEAGKIFKPEGPPPLISLTKKIDESARNESIIGEDLGRLGYRVHFLERDLRNGTARPEIVQTLKEEKIAPNRTPDILINGKVFDVYTPTNRDPILSFEAIRQKVAEQHQTHRVVLRVDEGLDPKNTERYLTDLKTKFRKIAPADLHEVLVLYYPGEQAGEIPKLRRLFP